MLLDRFRQTIMHNMAEYLFTISTLRKWNRDEFEDAGRRTFLTSGPAPHGTAERTPIINFLCATSR